MAKKIMYAKSNVEGDKKKKIYCGDQRGWMNLKYTYQR